jgi:hypothetical protein
VDLPVVRAEAPLLHAQAVRRIRVPSDHRQRGQGVSDLQEALAALRLCAQPIRPIRDALAVQVLQANRGQG